MLSKEKNNRLILRDLDLVGIPRSRYLDLDLHVRYLLTGATARYAPHLRMQRMYINGAATPWRANQLPRYIQSSGHQLQWHLKQYKKYALSFG